MSSAMILMFVAIIIVGAGILIIITATGKSKKSLDVEKYRERWLTISNSVSSDAGSQQLAIIHADKLLDQALKDKGYSGTTMAERMKSAQAIFRHRDAVWTAHKLRNRIAHEDTVKLNPAITKGALAAFKKALADVGAI